MYCLLAVCLLSVSLLYGQGNPMIRLSQTRAVIVGISDYQNISDLEFAHRDAEELANYLQSPAGGGVAPDNIRLLLNNEATQMQFAMALDWLQEESQAGDRAIIYFSGHGDVEKKTARQRGFLLTHDAPSTTYMAGGAFPLLFLQDIVNTLSAEKKVEVILVADACRSGKLAGNSINGNHITAEKLAESFANEIKILSCQKDEESQEGKQWGGGRGVFTYHLIEGLIGLADESGDESVNLREIRNYLERQVGKETGGAQYPLVIGDLGHDLASVDRETLAALTESKSITPTEPMVALGRNPKLPQTGKEKVDTDSVIWKKYLAFKQALHDHHLVYPREGAAYSIFKEIQDESLLQSYQQDMKRNLAIALHDEVQQAINSYLQASAEELSRRWLRDERYQYYPEYLAIAAELLGPDHFMYKDLKVRRLYFEGLQLRLKGEERKEKSLYTDALEKQRQVLQMDSSAAYAYNEIGLLFRRLDRKREAPRYFDEANTYSPNWVVPMANQSATYADLGELGRARKVAQQALKLDSTYALLYHNLAFTYDAEEKLDKAIELYEKAIHFNPDHRFTYYNLGLIHFQRGDLGKTEQNFLAFADKLPKPEPGIWSDLGLIADLQKKDNAATTYFNRALEIDPEYANTYYNLGEFHRNFGRLQKAEAASLKYLEKHPEDPDGHYLLATILAGQHKTDAAIRALQAAVDLGFEDATELAGDENLKNLHDLPAYRELLEQIKR